MAYWLLKTEPASFAWDDLVRDGSAVWDGVSNAVALKHLRNMKKGDQALIYHTGDERAAVGIADVSSAPYPDPKEQDERLVVADLKPKSKLSRPVFLSEIKSDPAFAGWDFLRIGRLSVVPVPDKMWERLLELSRGATAEAPGLKSAATTTAKAPKSRRAK